VQCEEYFEKFPRRLQSWLDAGSGSRILEIPEVKQLIREALRFFDGQRYQLDEFIVASNHVHAIVTPFAEFELSRILHSWKSFTAHEILKIEAASRRLQASHAEASCGEVGVAAESRKSSPGPPTQTVWQKESFDHIVRSPESLEKFRAYIRAHDPKHSGACSD
jgi:REP element-mobilizing transposase RayT